MARPRKEGLDYFPMCVSLDIEIEAVCAVYGNDALAVWITILRECYRTGRSQIALTPRTSALLALRSRVSLEHFGTVVKAFAEEGVFDETLLSHGVISSHGVEKQLGKVLAERERDRGRKWLLEAGNELSTGKPPVIPELSEGIRPKGKGNRKEKENKERENPRPSFEEVSGFFAEKLHPGEAQKFWDYYEANGWKVGRNPMKKWRNAASGWISRSGSYSTRPTAPHPNAPGSGLVY